MNGIVSYRDRSTCTDYTMSLVAMHHPLQYGL